MTSPNLTARPRPTRPRTSHRFRVAARTRVRAVAVFALVVLALSGCTRGVPAKVKCTGTDTPADEGVIGRVVLLNQDHTIITIFREHSNDYWLDLPVSKCAVEYL